MVDPAALPEDADARLKKRFHHAGRELANEGAVGRIDYDSDGGYVVHFYIDEPVPENKARRATQPREAFSLRN